MDTVEQNDLPSIITPERLETRASGTDKSWSDSSENSQDNAPQEGDTLDTDIPIPTDRLVDDFTADLVAYNHQEELSLIAMMSLGTRATAEMPTIKTGKWNFTDKAPNPISIRRARRMLATAYAKVPSTQKGAGMHGHAYIAEHQEEWLKREGTSTLEPPKKPEEDFDDIQGQLKYAREMERYLLYHHLVQTGNEKLITWFGKAMFLDLCHKGELKTDATPKILLAHLEATYSQSADELDYFEAVDKAFNAPYNARKPVEEYFMTLQEAQEDSKDLGVGFTDTQVITQALRQFIKQHGKEGRKNANKWNEETDKSWETFKIFWKRKIHEMGRTKEANAVERIADDLGSLRSEFLALQVENQTVKERNDELENSHYAFQTEIARAHATSSARDDASAISAITDAMSQMEQRIDRKMAAFNANLSSSSNTTITEDSLASTEQRNKIKVAKNRRPDAYKKLNGGRGKQFMFYCWNEACGVNCHHNTDRCYELTKEQKAKYKHATVYDRMGGSEKNLQRFGRFQSEYNFDSL